VKKHCHGGRLFFSCSRLDATDLSSLYSDLTLFTYFRKQPTVACISMRSWCLSLVIFDRRIHVRAVISTSFSRLAAKFVNA